MIALEIDEKALNKINEKFKALDNLFKKKAMAKLADMIFEEADNLADTHTKSGVMLKALYINKNSDLNYIIGFDDNLSPYAKYVHFGTKPHQIKPKNCKFLKWADNDNFIFSKSANHPGYTGDPFLYEAVKSEITPFMRWLDKEIENATN